MVCTIPFTHTLLFSKALSLPMMFIVLEIETPQAHGLRHSSPSKLTREQTSSPRPSGAQYELFAAYDFNFDPTVLVFPKAHACSLI